MAETLVENDLPEEFFDDLFTEETYLADRDSIQTVIKDREESEIDVYP